MKNLFEKIFKKEPQLNYIFAEYYPVEINSISRGVKTTKYDSCEPFEMDEMQIDKIYQCL
jgi:hypothetical protein